MATTLRRRNQAAYYYPSSGPKSSSSCRTRTGGVLEFKTKEATKGNSTPLDEQACISRSARGAVWGVLTCLFVLSRYKGPEIFFACGAPRIPLEISKETVFSLQCFSFGPGAVLGGAYMLVRRHACSCTRVFIYGRYMVHVYPPSKFVYMFFRVDVVVCFCCDVE